MKKIFLLVALCAVTHVSKAHTNDSIRVDEPLMKHVCSGTFIHSRDYQATQKNVEDKYYSVTIRVRQAHIIYSDGRIEYF